MTDAPKKLYLHALAQHKLHDVAISAIVKNGGGGGGGDSGLNVNEQDENGNTFLHISAMANDDCMFQRLYDRIQKNQDFHPFDATIINNDGDTPFHIVMRKKNNTNVYYLTKLYSDEQFRLCFDTVNNDGDTPLHIAFRGGYGYGVNHVLWQKRFDVNFISPARPHETYLGLAIEYLEKNAEAKNSHYNAVEGLLKIGAKTNPGDGIDPPLYHALKMKSITCLTKFSCLRKVKMDGICPSTGRTMLTEMLVHLDLKTIVTIFESADIPHADDAKDGEGFDVVDKRGRTTLSYMVEMVDLEKVRFVINRGANINACNGDERGSLLHVLFKTLKKKKQSCIFADSFGGFIKSDYESDAESDSDADAESDAESDSDADADSDAESDSDLELFSGRKKKIRKYIDNGDIEIDVLPECRENYEKALKKVYESGRMCDIISRIKERKRIYRILHICEILVDLGIDLSATDQDGDTALHVLMDGRYSLSYIFKTYLGKDAPAIKEINPLFKVFKLLINNGARVDAKNNHYKIPPHNYINHKYLDLDDVFAGIDRSDFKTAAGETYDFDFRTDTGGTYIHYLVEKGYTEPFFSFGDFLEFFGMDIDQKNDSGKTALYCAAEKTARSGMTEEGRLRCVLNLIQAGADPAVTDEAIGNATYMHALCSVDSDILEKECDQKKRQEIVDDIFKTQNRYGECVIKALKTLAETHASADKVLSAFFGGKCYFPNLIEVFRDCYGNIDAVTQMMNARSESFFGIYSLFEAFKIYHEEAGDLVDLELSKKTHLDDFLKMQDLDGNTALHLALINNNSVMAFEIFHRVPALKTIKNNKGLTPVENAVAKLGEFYRKVALEMMGDKEEGEEQ